MAVRPIESSGVNWQKDRLFVIGARQNIDWSPRRPIHYSSPCQMGCHYDVDETRGMLSIRVGMLMAALRALYALLGEE